MGIGVRWRETAGIVPAGFSIPQNDVVWLADGGDDRAVGDREIPRFTRVARGWRGLVELVWLTPIVKFLVVRNDGLPRAIARPRAEKRMAPTSRLPIQLV